MRGGLDRIGDADESRRPAIDRDEHHGLALAPEFVGAASQRTGVDAERLQVPQVTDCHRAAIDGAGHALAGYRLEVR